jgi:voltage-gated potassium channel
LRWPRASWRPICRSSCGVRLQLAARQDEAWAAALLQRLRGQVGDEILESWAQSLRQAQSFAELRARVEARSGPQRAVPLMRLRQGDAVLVQGEDFELLPDDLLLMTGCARSRRQFRAWARR